MENIVIFITCANLKEAEKISKQLLEKKLTACANLVRGVSSRYWWKGKIQKSNEIMLIMKSRKRLFKKIISEVKKNHSYEVPEIIALPIIAGNPEYLEWIKESTK
ncbi:MAG: divalent-cation tolerance protein CutA [Elusimicrobia bacterium]|nr:divalent-cation tolerance protein CutA [Elusimicrobiota bacterium]